MSFVKISETGGVFGRVVPFVTAVAFMLTVGGLGLSPTAARAEVIKLRADNWCPYNCDPASDKPGVLIEIASIVFAAAGHSIEYKIMPWSRTLGETRKGRIAGAVGAHKTEAPDLIYGAAPIAFDDAGFAVKKDRAFVYQGPSSLDPFRIAVIKDYNYDEGEIDAYLKANAGSGGRIQPNTGDAVGEANIRKLLAGKVDMVIDSFAVLEYIVAKFGAGDAIRVVPLGRPAELFIGFSPNLPQSQEWAGLLVSGVETLRRQGKLAEILARYGLKDWKQ